ncbi:unnamed protein product [Oppiella nova]|uniref:Uncharacterized protein n=1 Tax=Oppiella nova TaxID=334625 RepID=A0A7R9MFV0_9ACAR|nr:unnamed protein product [Oppiella nova]CAG2176444.1 unnamed protein product [Oppiella nova]
MFTLLNYYIRAQIPVVLDSRIDRCGSGVRGWWRAPGVHWKSVQLGLYPISTGTSVDWVSTRPTGSSSSSKDRVKSSLSRKSAAKYCLSGSSRGCRRKSSQYWGRVRPTDFRKHRYVPKVTTGKKLSLYTKLKHEEQVMKYLSKPYITQEQEEAYLKSVGRTRPQYWDDFLRQPLEEPLKQYFAADFLERLDLTRSFDEED